MQLSAADTFTTPVLKQRSVGFDVGISGTFSGTITIQARKLEADDWIDIGSTDVPDVFTGEHATAWFVRAGFKAGDYTSGTAEVEVY